MGCGFGVTKAAGMKGHCEGVFCLFVFNCPTLEFSIWPVCLNNPQPLEKDVGIWNVFSEFWVSLWFCLKQFVCLRDWNAWWFPATDSELSWTNAISNLGTQGPAENRERLALSASNNKIRFSPESCKPAYLGNYHSKLPDLKETWKKGREER